MTANMPRWTVAETGPAVPADLCALSDEVVARPQDLTWWRPGRSAWYPLPNASPRALKVKGIGNWTSDGVLEPPSTAVPYLRPRAHVGITESGGFRVVESAPAPTGGIAVDRAAREFECARRMRQADGLGTSPLRLYRNEGTELAVVVMVEPTANPYRCDQLFVPPSTLDGARKSFVDEVIGGRELATTIAGLSSAYGAALRRFTDAGHFRHSGSLDNWALATERGTEGVYLTDLDSTRELARVRDPRRPLEVLRDVASGVFNLAAAIMIPGGRCQSHVDEDSAARIFGSLVRSYFHDAPATAADAVVAGFVRYWWPLARRSWRDSGVTNGVGRGIWMDRDLAYCLLIRGLAAPYARSGLGKELGAVNAEGLEAAIEAYIGPMRSRRMRNMMAPETAGQ